MEWAIRLIGLFYLFGGVVLLGQALSNYRLQRKLCSLMAVSTKEKFADAMVAVGGCVVLLSGVALMALSRWAVLAFVAGWVIQASYLLWASQILRSKDAMGGAGRRRSLDAFAIYTLATGFVLWLPMMGLLR